MAGKNAQRKRARREKPQSLQKAPVGIEGFDILTGGGLPRGRTTLVVGASGSGKTVFGMEFLVRGADLYGEPGVFMSFEESEQELAENFASMGFDLAGLAEQGKLFLESVDVAPGLAVEAGRYDLEGLFARLEHATETVGARRVVLDAVAALFHGLADASAVRIGLSRLFLWLKARGITSLVTVESQTDLARHGLGRSLSDCVVQLSTAVVRRVATRYLRIAKYRGSTHKGDEFPFLISNGGMSVLPLTSVVSDYGASTERISTGIDRLDAMLGGSGYLRGSSILVSGEAGTGKSSVAATLVDAACRRGERCLYFAFEESQAEILRNMGSIGLDLAPLVRKGLLSFEISRAGMCGLETHLVRIEDSLTRFEPRVAVLDPMTSLVAISGGLHEVKSMVSRLMDYLKAHGITALFTALVDESEERSGKDVGVSSLMDTWILLRNREVGGEQNRLLTVIKSRGTAHSNQVREFLITASGVDLADVYAGPGGVLAGSARLGQEARERMENRRQALELARERTALEARIASLKADLESAEKELRFALLQAEENETDLAREREEMARSRGADGERRK